MPHINVKLATGKSEQQKTQLVEAIVKDVMAALHSEKDNVSVALEEIDPKDWKEKVYQPEIQGHWDQLYKKPGYSM